MFLRFIHLTAVALNLALCLYLLIEPRLKTARRGKVNNGAARGRAGGKLTFDEYKLYSGFYKFFLDFALKANVFFYGITGGILAILYNRSGAAGTAGAHPLPPPVSLILLITPFVISLVLGGAFIVGARFWHGIAEEVHVGLEDMEEKLKVNPRLHYLTVLLAIFGGIFAGVSCGLGYLIWWHYTHTT